MQNMIENRVGYQIRRAEYELRTATDNALRDLGLNTAQYEALSVLEETPGLSGTALARRCPITRRTMNRVLMNLETAGLVMRRPHPEHGRIMQAFLTEAGEELMPRAHRIVRAIERQMLKGLDRNERRRLLNALRDCSEALETAMDPRSQVVRGAGRPFIPPRRSSL